MKFLPLPLQGAFLIEPEPVTDKRGFFARSFCANEFERHGLETRFVQCNISFNKKKGTLRGMHFQGAQYKETKLVRCTTGSIYDVIVDIRQESSTYKKWFATDLSAASRRMLYVPNGFAHGFLTLEDNTEVFYQMTEIYHPEYSRGVRWDDPELAIDWPQEVIIVSDRDQQYPDFDT